MGAADGRRPNGGRALLCTLLACIAACSDAGIPAVNGPAGPAQETVAAVLACRLSAPEQVPLAQPVVPVTFTLTNRGSVVARILARQTALEGMLGDLFEVTLDGRRLDYRGPMVKRGPPSDDEYVSIAPGSHAQATVDLLEGYDLGRAGRYAVRLVRQDEFGCNELTIERQ